MVGPPVRDQPAEGHQGMTIGLGVFRGKNNLRLDRLLLQPFLNLKNETNED